LVWYNYPKGNIYNYLFLDNIHMIIKKCARCGKLMPYGGRWCEVCKPIAEAEQEQRRQERQKERQRIADQKRKDDPVTRFYRSKEWITLSKAYLQSVRWRCERCGRVAECVHHKHYIRSPGGWEKRLEWENLEGLCSSCHAAEHSRSPGDGKRRTPGRSKK
jgi:5-methylcytosine-specific restriction endonuclease McrA